MPPPRGTPSHLPPASDMLGHPSCLGAHTPGLTTCPSHALAHSGGWNMFPGGWELEDLPGAAACLLPPASCPRVEQETETASGRMEQGRAATCSRS